MSGNDEFRSMVRDFANGETDAIIMHIETVVQLAPDEWDLLKAAGATVVVVHKALPSSDR